jgi:hypothetical protein
MTPYDTWTRRYRTTGARVAPIVDYTRRGNAIDLAHIARGERAGTGRDRG